MKALRLDAPLSLWGGLDPETGVIIDERHPQCGECMAGRVLVIPRTSGSTSGPSVLAECFRNGVGPIRIELEAPDAALLAATAVARELYGVDCPIIVRS